MIEFLEHLDPLHKGLWYVAIPASIIFLLQTVLTFVGADASDGLSADFDSNLDGGHAPFQLFSFRNLINFLIGFSWSGIAFYPVIENKLVLMFCALAVGISFLYLFLVIIRQMTKLAEDNTFRLSSTLNKTAEVYIPIPAGKSGTGKIMLSVNGAYHELEAITLHDRIPTGTVVRVTGIESDSILIVETL